MITNEDIKNLAGLARLELSLEEAESLAPEVESILKYVSQVQNIAGDLDRVVPKLRNVMREDVVTNKPGEYTEQVLENAPDTEGDYLKVKKIL